VIPVARLSLVVVLTLAGPSLALAQGSAPPPTPPAPTTSTTGQAAAAPTGPPLDYLFPSGAGLVIFHVAPAKVADFDFVVGRLREALLKAPQGDRARQAEHWAIYKSAEKSTESIPYLFMFDPALPQASYDPVFLLAELLPDETQALYERLKAAVIRIERMGLTKIR
jgi:hypothetical protein